MSKSKTMCVYVKLCVCVCYVERAEERRVCETFENCNLVDVSPISDH